MPKKIDMPSDEKAKLLLEAAEEKLAENVTLLDLRGKTLIFDFLLICNGSSDVQIRAISNNILEKAKDAFLSVPKIEGQSVGEWILMDFGDVVVHIMNEETRARYRLEDFWTTTQPKGALSPLPDGVDPARFLDPVEVDAEFDEEELDEEELDALDLDEEEWDDAAFFDDAETEVDPIDEDDLDDFDDEKEEGGTIPIPDRNASNGTGK